MIEITKNLYVDESVFEYCRRNKKAMLNLLTMLKNQGYIVKINSPFTLRNLQLSLLNQILGYRKYVYSYRLKSHYSLDDYDGSIIIAN